MNRKQLIIGVAVLLVGTLVYLIDRPPEQTYFVKNSPIKITLFTTIPNVFGSIGGSLPAFVHVFSFILITAGILSCNGRGYRIICLSWFLLDAAFEVGQHFTAWPSKIIPDWFTGIPFLKNTESYFLHGTFDFIDLTAIAFGALIAYVVLLTTQRRRVMS
jgi:ABC-type xylose transport system permease subunit